MQSEYIDIMQQLEDKTLLNADLENRSLTLVEEIDFHKRLYEKVFKQCKCIQVLF